VLLARCCTVVVLPALAALSCGVCLLCTQCDYTICVVCTCLLCIPLCSVSLCAVCIGVLCVPLCCVYPPVLCVPVCYVYPCLFVWARVLCIPQFTGVEYLRHKLGPEVVVVAGNEQAVKKAQVCLSIYDIHSTHTSTNKQTIRVVLSPPPPPLSPLPSLCRTL
jgi:hypothetical protein